jgi:HSP20 family molecular chaperone IbpA
MTRYTIHLALILFIVIQTLKISTAQTGKIQGTVYDKLTKTPLKGVKGAVKGLESIYIITGDYGNYSMTLNTGKYTINFSMAGYKTEKIKVDIKSDSLKILNVYIEAETKISGEKKNKGVDSEISKSTGKKDKTKSEVKFSAPVVVDEVVEEDIKSSYDELNFMKVGESPSLSDKKAEFPKSISDVETGELEGITFPEDDTKSTSSKTMRISDVETGEDKIITIPETDIKPITSQTFKPGTLTAGEIHDFSKWKLWEDIDTTDLERWRSYWQIKPFQRFTVQLSTERGMPIVDAKAQLMDGKQVIWSSKTDNTGKAELWADLFKEQPTEKEYSIQIQYNNDTYEIEKAKKFHDGVNALNLKTECNMPSQVDISFVVDATGSMGDEINYLKAELSDVVQKIKDTLPNLQLRLGSVFYRDKGDEYITRFSQLSSTISQTTEFINQQLANGGGDNPEAVDSALQVAIYQSDWSKTAVARIIFMVLDAPPHYNPEVLSRLQNLLQKASAEGIRIIPVTCSGIDKSTEYLMRTFALATNGTYTFLTDHSGVGNPHIAPTTDKYNVELLNNLLIRLVFEYSFTPNCKNSNSLMAYLPNDSAQLKNLDVRKNNGNPTLDSLKKTTVTDTTKIIKQGNQTDPPVENTIICYPNPTDGLLFIKFTAQIDEIYLTDISGKILQKIYPKNSPLEINIGQFPSGIYNIRYLTGNKLKNSKIILIRK